MKYTREESLAQIRRFLVSQRRKEETTCQTTARLGIFCKGYDRWSTQQLANLYPWLANKLPPDASREELLELIADWDNARMLMHNVPTTCDAHEIDQESCIGFDRFSNAELKRMFPQLFKSSDTIAD